MTNLIVHTTNNLAYVHLTLFSRVVVRIWDGTSLATKGKEMIMIIIIIITIVRNSRLY